MILYHDIYGRYGIEDCDNQVEAEQTRGSAEHKTWRLVNANNNKKEVGSWMTILYTITITIVL